ncbi:sodium-coupled monocarboxylate transporter 2-like isoform X2 [Anneissia japonica]|uniref:sodium-coupled monocarboxylate transporter 2-like isoform X2 n=1 Tax=Anneissia japonica TaxID=1529436 RepID=UPI001425B390|nr:sodium-coupled monocarboxylate transporter 2-like isoform X2 [Anneissia japonica]
MSAGEVASFTIIDYVVFALVLVISAAIGIYYGFKDGGQQTTQKFLMADRSMRFFAVGFSLLASWMSAIALLGTPAECYLFGTEFWVVILSYPLMTMLTAHCYIPVFYRLKLTSVYEVMYMSVVLYAPALALNAVTGLSLYGSIVGIGLVCTFYTSLGGLKAVIWTDVFQSCIMFIGLLTIIIQGSVALDGFGNIWEINKQNGRINTWDFSVDITNRHTVWNLIIGGTFTWLGIFGCNQASVQRYLSCPTLRDAKLSLYFNLPLMSLLISLTMMCGLVIFAMYADCDPIKAGYVSKADQLLPFYVMDQLGFIKGLPGLFVAAIFSGALSTVSSGLNSLAAVTLEDVIKPFQRGRNMAFLPDPTATLVTKILACCYGVVAIGMAFASSKLGPVLQVALSLLGVIGGPILGVYSLGLFFPWANKWGGLIGLLSGFGLSFWISIGAYFYPPTNPTLPTSVDGCYESENATFTTMTMISTAVPTAGPPDPPIADLYHVSYMWYSAIGCLTVVVVGLITSFITGRTDPKEVNPKLISPIVETVFCCMPESWRETVRCGVEFGYDDDLKEEENASGDYSGREEDQRKINEKLELHIMNGVDTHL